MKTVIDPKKELVKVKVRVGKMQSAVLALKIKDEKTLNEAVKILSGIKDVARQVKEKKEEITKPLNAALVAARAFFRPMEAQCEEAERQVKHDIVVYNAELEAARTLKEVELAARVEAGTLKVETAAKKLENVPTAITHHEAEKGAITIRKVKKFRVVDISKLPLPYHLADETAIRRQMNAGVELPGVEYFEENQVAAQ